MDYFEMMAGIDDLENYDSLQAVAREATWLKRAAELTHIDPLIDPQAHIEFNDNCPAYIRKKMDPELRAELNKKLLQAVVKDASMILMRQAL